MFLMAAYFILGFNVCILLKKSTADIVIMSANKENK